MHMPGLARWMSGAGPLTVEAARNAAADAESTDQGALYLGLAAALHGGPAETGAEATPRRLIVLRPTDLSRAAFGEFTISRQVMLVALQRPRETPPAERTMAEAETALAFTETTGPVDRAAATARAWGRSAWNGLKRLANPDPVSDLTAWLGQTRAQAILFQLDSAAPDDLYLLMSKDTEVDAVLAALERVAERGIPLDGHLALLTWDNAWTTWTDTTRLPVLEEPLSQRNWRGVVGNFASARPRLFVGMLAGIALLSVLAANSYIAASRRQR